MYLQMDTCISCKRKHFKLQLHVIASWIRQHTSILITPFRLTILFTVQTHHLQNWS